MKRYVSYVLMLCVVCAAGLSGCKKGAVSLNSGDASPEGPSIAEVRSEKKDLSKYLVKYYLPAKAEVSSESQVVIEESSDPFSIVDFGPQDELPAEVKKPSVYVLFSQPVIPLKMLGEPAKESPYISIEPPIKGVYRWYGTRLLSFDADEEALPQRLYTVTVKDSVKSLGGKSLTGVKSFSFRTEYLSVREFLPGGPEFYGSTDDVPLEDAKNITLRFSYPVNLGVIKDYLSVRSGGRQFPFELSQPQKEGLSDYDRSRTVLLSLRETPPENTSVEVLLKEGARSEADYIGTPKDALFSFSTLKPFTYSYFDIYSYSYPGSADADSNPVYLTFSHPVREEGLAQFISTLPPMPIASENLSVWNNIVKISNLPVSFGSKYAVKVSGGLKDAYGRQLGRDQSIDIEVPPPGSYAYFPNTGTRILEAQFPPKIVYEFQNIDDGDYKFAPISDPYTFFKPEELSPYDFSRMPRNTRHFEVLDLRPFLNKDGKGFVGMSWNFEPKNKNGKRPDWGRSSLNLQVTDLAITTRYGYNKVVALVSSLKTGKPVPKVKVSLMRKNTIVREAATDAQGLATFALKPGEYVQYFADSNRYSDALRILADNGSDKLVFEPNMSHNVWHFGVYNTESPVEIEKPEMVAFIFTDRGLYKPGETVTFRGIDRTLHLGTYEPYEGSYTITLKESSYYGSDIDSKSGKTSESGGFFGSFDLPQDMEPGFYSIQYERGEEVYSIGFQVAYFERLKYSVSVSSPDVTYYQGDSISMQLSAEYLSGGALGNADYEYSWYKEPWWWNPKGSSWSAYTFGSGEYDQRYSLSSKTGKLDPEGKVQMRQDTTPEGVEGLPYAYNVEAIVQDASYQQIAAASRAVVHPAKFYIGVKMSSGSGSFARKGEKVSFSSVLLRPDSTPYPADGQTVKAELYHEEWKMAQQRGVAGRINTRWERVTELEAESLVSFKGSEGSFQFSPSKAGSYSVKLYGTDKEGRKALTQLHFYVTGSDWVRWGAEDSDDIGLKLDKTIYKPGENAKVLIQSPLPQGTYLVTVEREGILDEQIVEIKGSAETISIPIKESYVPVVYVSVCSYSVRTKAPDHTYFEPDLDKPKGYFGIVSLAVDSGTRSFDVAIQSNKLVYRSGGEAEVTLLATKNGKPLADAELTFLAVDRGVLDLINYHVPNPVEFFYSPDRFPLGVFGADSRSLLIDPVTYEVKDLYGGEGEDGKLEERKDFKPTAIFEPFIKTDREGKAVVRFKLPDTLTTYRCTAIGVKGDTFAISEGEIKVQNPLNVRSVIPKKLRLRDTAEVGVLLTNLDEQEREITVKVSSDNLGIEGKPERTVKVKRGASLMVWFEAAALKPGEAELVFTTTSDILSERLVQKINVEKPYIYESFATMGKVDGTADAFVEEGLVIPAGADDGEGSLSLVLDGTRLSSLKEAVDYLFHYPYGCLEQRTAAILPLVIFKDYMEAFDLRSEVKDVKATVESELAYWAKYQTENGGFPYWPDSAGRESYYVSLRVAHILAYCRQNGFTLPGALNVQRLLTYLRRPDEHAAADHYLLAYSLYVRSLLGDQTARDAQELFRAGDSLGISGYCFVGLAAVKGGNIELAGRCLDRVKGFLRPGTQGVDLTETYERTSFYGSQTESLALTLMLYNALRPSDEMASRVLFTMLKSQKSGYWFNTADTVRVLESVADLIKREGGSGPNLTASVTMNGASLLEGTLQGLAAKPVVQSLPFKGDKLKDVKRDALQALRFAKKGDGSLYYTATLKYALPSELLYARDEGIGLFTEIYDLDGNKIDGTKLGVGKTYRMKAVVSSPRRRSYLALRLPVPSGAEILDASFVTTAKRPAEAQDFESPDYYDEFSDYYEDWYDAPLQVIMENEVRFFFDDFEQGKKEVSFLFRTSARGIYPTPPATAECMYEPEVFGRNDGKLFIVE